MHRLRRMIVVPIILGLALSAGSLPLSHPDDAASGRAPVASPATASASAAPVAAPAADGRVASAIGRRPHRSVARIDGPATAREGTGSAGSTGAVTAAATRIVPGSVNRASVHMSTTYDAALNLNFGTRAIVVDTILSATNRSGGPVDRIELNTIAARLGGLRLGSVSVDGRAAIATVHDQTIVLWLGGVLPDGATVKARVIYRATLRSSLGGSNWLFTQTNGIAGLYRWLPWVSLDVPFDRPNHGDPFVTSVSPRVTVRITTDRPLVFATTGDRIAVSGLTQTFEARNVRDFTVTGAPDFRTSSRVVGGTTVRVWYRPGFPASTALDQAARAIERMGALLGPYPYLHFKVVQSAGGYGMESPGLIWIPTGVASSNLPYLVYHETAHQWFYGIVGGNQAYEPFTDEAAADFLARDLLGSRRSSRCGTGRLDLSIYQYSSSCYYEVVYIQGGNFLNEIRSTMGATAFWRGMRAWMTSRRFALVPTKSLLDTLDAHTPINLVPRYEPRFPRLY